MFLDLALHLHLRLEMLLAHPLLPWRPGCKIKISLRPVYFAKSNFFIIRKNVQLIFNKKKFSLIFKKKFYFKRKTLSRNCKKFKNIILFTNYIKFGPQFFNFF